MPDSFRPWQAEAFQRFWSTPYCYLIAPPGQGKSNFAQAWATKWAERGKKVLIATPRKLIQSSFKGEASWQWGHDGRGEGGTHHYLYREPRVPLRTWLTQAADPHAPHFVSTHAGLLVAFAGLTQDHGGVLVDDLAVVIDETHLLSSAEQNQMGRLFQLLFEHRIPLLIMTATPYRGDGLDVIPHQVLPHLEVYNRDFATALDEAVYIEGLSSEVVVGQVMGELRLTLSTVLEKNRYVVIKLPGVTSNHSYRLARELGIPIQEDGLKYQFEAQITKMCDELGLSHMSLVEESSAELDDQLSLAREATGTPDLPRVVIAQERVNMGVDCPWWTDAIMIGSTRSAVLTVQFGTRSGRDHFSKKGTVPSFLTLVPEFWEPEVDPQDAMQFAQDLILAKLVWLFVTGEGVDAPVLVSPTCRPEQPRPTQTTDKDKTQTIPQHPNVQAQVLMDAIEAAQMGQVDPNQRAMVTLLRKRPIKINPPTGTPIPPSHGGNQLPELPYLDVAHMTDDQVMVELHGQVVRLAREVMRGQAREFSAYLKAQAITPSYIVGLYQNGKSVGDIRGVTGWSNSKVEKVLEDRGLISKPEKRTRPRGEKFED